MKFVAIKTGEIEKQPTAAAAAGRKACYFEDRTVT